MSSSQQNIQQTSTQQGSQPSEQNQGVHLKEGEGGSLSAKTSGIGIYSDYSITDPNYQPQSPILSMSPEARTAFLAQFDLARFNGNPIRELAVPFLKHLETIAGVRLAFFPVRERASTTLTGSGVDTSAGVTEKESQVASLPVLSPTATPITTARSIDPTGSVSSTNAPVAASPPASEMFTPSYLRTTNNFIVQATSAVYALRSSVPIKEDHWESSFTPFKAGAITTGPLLFANISQLPSEANRMGHVHPMKPCMHLMLFTPYTASPLCIVERHLGEKKRILRVFNGKLDIFGKIECTQAFAVGAKKVTITGPDQEFPLFTIKAAKTDLLSGVRGKMTGPFEYYIKQGKKKVGYYTTRYSVSERAYSDIVPLDVFFPVNETNWSTRIMLIVAGLYTDFLFSD